MKSTKKRFSEGGTSEDKEAGLKASKGEDVGFFERLRMGNIDDPKSEAFKRLGAGRGASERGRSVPVEDRVATPVTRMPDRDEASSSPAYSGGMEQEENTPVITDQYLGKAPAVIQRQPAPAARVQTKAKPSVSAAKISSSPTPQVAISEMDEVPYSKYQKPKEAEDDTSLSLAQRMARRKERMKTSKPTDERSVTQRLKEQFGFKKGGVVSASRGDGIAQRGKTRGKIY